VKESSLDLQAAFSRPEWADTPSARHYHDLIDRAQKARIQGEHWQAQQLASAAHKWAMTELARLQRLEQAQQWLAETARRLERAWDQDRACATVDELRAGHPEFKRVISAWESAEERVRELVDAGPQPPLKV